MVYVENSSAPNRRQVKTSEKEDRPFELPPKKSGPYKVVQAAPHTVTTDIDGLHNIIATDQMTLPQAAQKFN